MPSAQQRAGVMAVLFLGLLVAWSVVFEAGVPSLDQQTKRQSTTSVIEADPHAINVTNSSQHPVSAKNELHTAATATTSDQQLLAGKVGELVERNAEKNGGEERKVISWIGVGPMNKMISRYWGGNLFCEEILAARQNVTNLPITVNISFGCSDLFRKSNLGTGNFISAFYHMRMSAMALEDVDIHVTCHDAEEQKSKLILPWVMGHYPAQPDSRQRLGLTVKETCGKYRTSKISHMYKEMQYVLRRMAIGLVGVVSKPNHPSALFAEEQLWSSDNHADGTPGGSSGYTMQLAPPQRTDKPPFPPESFEMDDAVIHFRCGDLMALNHPSFGFMKFSGYTKYISKEARSIGIVTQPFDKHTQERKFDANGVKRQRCRIVVLSLVDYIRERFPNASINIHNGPNETIALAYARMVMANQTIIGISSFGVFPGVATFGTGYIKKPDFPKAPNKFLIQPRIDELTSNVVLISEPRIMCASIKGLWQKEGEEGVLKWFWSGNDTMR